MTGTSAIDGTGSSATEGASTDGPVRRTHLSAAPPPTELPSEAPSPDAALEVAGPDVAAPDVAMVQLLDRHGLRVSDPTYVSSLTDADILALYREMRLTRRFDREATNLQRQGELGLWASSLGQEAAQIGAAYALADGDFVVPSYREHGLALARGVDPVVLLKMFRGVDYGSWDSAAHRFGGYTLVIGAQTLHAVGYAMGLQRDETGDAVLCCFGDGASSQGDVNEAFTFAAVNNAPVVFFLQNNQWAISAPTTRQSRVPLYQRAAGFGFPGVRVDGNDALAVHAVVTEALERARSGGGPTLVEAYTFRMGAHTTSDDPTRYRETAEEQYWRDRDPVDRVAAYLRSTGTLDDAGEAAIQAEGDELALRTRRGCLALVDPDVMTLYDHVLAEPGQAAGEDRDVMAELFDGDSDGPDQTDGRG